jgi:glycosyltransferase involved in cell wall biosynthesis
MKILCFGERVNIDLFKGDALLFRRMAEGLADKGNEVQALCHGHSSKMQVYSPLNFWFYTKVFTFPLTSFYSLRKFVSLLDKERFDAVILKLPVCAGNGLLFELRPSVKSSLYLKMKTELKKRKIPFFVFVEGITEKDNFLSSFMGCSKEIQINLMKEANGIICLSELQNNLLSFIDTPQTFFPAPVDTQKYTPDKRSTKLDLPEKKINLLYLSSYLELKDFLGFFDFMEANECILYIVSPFRKLPGRLDKEIKKRKLAEKFVLVENFRNEKLFELIPLFDAGVYLKKFGSAFADASYMMKISEYLSCGLPVLVPQMKGPLMQAGKAGINFERNKTISKKELKKLSVNARKEALNHLDLKKNINALHEFIEKNSRR